MIKKCLFCGKKFEFYNCKSFIKENRGKFCSRICARKGAMTNKVKEKIKNTLKEKYKNGELPHCFKKGNIPWCSRLKGEGIVKASPSSYKKGHKQYFFKHTEESKKKIKDTRKLRGLGYKKGHIPWNKNRKNYICKTDESKLWRRRKIYKQWREKIFRRDDWTCQKCIIKGGKLNPHHIKNFAQYKDLRFNVNNGITFCEKCHKKFHKIYGFKDNNYLQIKKFIKYEIIN